MTPQQKLKRAVILRGAELGDIERPNEEITAENVDSIFDCLDEDYALQDAKNEVRSSGTKTNLECQWSRHYESEAVAARMTDGSWVGWTYWYGGGKHGDPDAMEWIADAYEVECKEEEKLVVVQTFKAKNEATA